MCVCLRVEMYMRVQVPKDSRRGWQILGTNYRLWQATWCGSSARARSAING